MQVGTKLCHTIDMYVLNNFVRVIIKKVVSIIIINLFLTFFNVITNYPINILSERQPSGNEKEECEKKLHFLLGQPFPNTKKNSIEVVTYKKVNKRELLSFFSYKL